MMMRPPSREEVRAAQAHLVLLKSKLSQRQADGRGSYGQAPLAAYPPARGGAPPLPGSQRGRFERVGNDGQDDAGAGPARGPPQRGGMTWDPPPSSLDEQGALRQAPPAQSASSSRARRQPADEIGYPSPGAAGAGPGLDYGYDRGQAGEQSFGGMPSAGGSQLPMYAEDDDDDGPMIPCQDCGRTFKAKVLARHSRICKKVFVQKRKAFDSAANRLNEFENAQELIAKAHRIEKELDNPKPKAKEKKALPDWQKKSLEFRQAMLAAKAAAGDTVAAEKASELQQQLNAFGPSEPSGVKCPHCGRTFNKEAGERHIVICLKTFGSKNTGGRLTKGGGVGGGNSIQQPRPAPAAASSARATERRPSQHRRG